jgi:hypothetical protein
MLNLIMTFFIFLNTAAQAPAEDAHANVGAQLDQFLERTRVAAAAASVVKEADKYRQEAEAAKKAGQFDEARRLLRRAAEAIAAQSPDREEMRDDPFLRAYLSEIATDLIKLDQPAGKTSLFTTINKADLANPRVAASLNYFRKEAWFTAGLNRLTVYRPMMARIFREEGVPEWLLAVGLVESGFNTAALSPKQALGIWQFIPTTGARYGLQRTALGDERRHPEKSTRAAARYLRDLYALFGDWPLAIAAYNTGEGRMAKIMKRTGARDFWTMAARRLLPDETINYVPAVLAASHLFDSSMEEKK